MRERVAHAAGDVSAVQVETVLQKPAPILRYQSPQLALHLAAAIDTISNQSRQDYRKLLTHFI